LNRADEKIMYTVMILCVATQERFIFGKMIACGCRLI